MGFRFYEIRNSLTNLSYISFLETMIINCVRFRCIIRAA